MPKEFEQPKRMVLKEGQTGHILIQKGPEGASTVLEVRNPTDRAFSLEQIPSGSPEVDKEELLAKFPDILGRTASDRLTQQGTKVVGGEGGLADMIIHEDQIELLGWMKSAKKLGIGVEQVRLLTTEVLRGITIDSNRIGFMGPRVSAIHATIQDLTNKVWEVKKPKPNGQR